MSLKISLTVKIYLLRYMSGWEQINKQILYALPGIHTYKLLTLLTPLFPLC